TIGLLGPPVLRRVRINTPEDCKREVATRAALRCDERKKNAAKPIKNNVPMIILASNSQMESMCREGINATDMAATVQRNPAAPAIRMVATLKRPLRWPPGRLIFISAA